MTQKLELAVAGFSDGLNTEASVLNVLPSELMDGSVNVELLLNGSARRRKGVDFLGQSNAGGYLQLLRSSTSDAEIFQESPSVAVVRLTAPNGDLVDRVVVDLNNKFYVYKIDGDNSGLINIDSPYQIINRGIQSHDSQKFANMQFSQSGNKLFFAGLKCNPGYLKVNSDNITLGLTYINVLTRNLSATSLNARVQLNGAWYECIQSHTADASNQPGSGSNWPTFWFQLEGAIPSGTATWASGTSYNTTFVKTYNKDTAASATSTYPTTVEFFAGRMWLAGDPANPNAVYFSKVIVKDGDAERYCQFADPLDPTDPDVVDDDGGVISVQGAGLGYRLLGLAHTIFVGCSNGVWQVLGSSGIFRATSFQVVQVLTDSIGGPEAMCKVDKELVIFANHGIWHGNVETSLTSSVVGLTTFVSLNENRLETYYRSLPQSSKAAARCVYNQSDRRIYYFFNDVVTSFDSSYGALAEPGYTHNVLIMDARFNKGVLEQDPTNSALKRTLKGAFFLYTLADNADQGFPYIAAPFVIPSGIISAENVTDGGVNVTDGGIQITTNTTTFSGDTVLFLALQRINVIGSTTVNLFMAFGKLVGDTVTDWASHAGYKTSYDSIIKTGVQTLGDVLHKKAATYLFFVFKKVETGTLIDGVDTNQGGCLLRTAWQWSTSTTAVKYGSTQSVYIPDRFGIALPDGGNDGHDHVFRKARVRGRGNALQVILSNDGDKDFHLIGWTQQFYGKND